MTIELRIAESTEPKIRIAPSTEPDVSAADVARALGAEPVGPPSPVTSQTFPAILARVAALSGE